MRKFICLFLLGSIWQVALCQLGRGVATEKPLVRDQNNRGIIQSVYIYNGVTFVDINFYYEYIRRNNVSIASSIRLCYFHPKTSKYECLPAVKLTRGEEDLDSEFNKEYTRYDFGKLPATTEFDIMFEGMPASGVKTLYLEEPVKYGFYWKNIKINPIYTYQPKTIGGEGDVEERIYELIVKTNNPMRGIYEEVDDDDPIQLAFLEDEDGSICLVYYDGLDDWEVGEVKAELRQTVSPYVYKADWYTDFKQKVDAVVTYDKGVMEVTIGDKTYTYVKMKDQFGDIPVGKTDEEQWSGTGFALNNGYIATNYHVVENAKSLKVRGIKGDFNIEYNATVVSTDKLNDLAIIKIADDRFSGFGTIPYRVKTSISEVGEDIFVLGYPLTTVMGDEIKLTTGVISSKTGFQGDVSLYQISAPVQPGNSGGPLFDGNGNLIGIVNSKFNGAENVGYAIKTSYLNNLVESTSSVKLLPTNNAVSGMTLSNKVKSLKNFVFMITCSNNVSNNQTSHYDNISSTTILGPPSVRSSTTERTKIESVILTKDYTAVEMVTNNHSDDEYFEWCSIDKGTCLIVNGKRYIMTRAEGIKVAPAKTYFSYAGQNLTFTLYFPPIPASATSMDLIESEDSDWKFYGIKIK